jgi:hypothetical protein
LGTSITNGILHLLQLVQLLLLGSFSINELLPLLVQTQVLILCNYNRCVALIILHLRSTGLLFNTTSSQVGTAFLASTLNNFTYVSGSTTTNFSGATNAECLVLETLSEGVIMNSSSSLDASGALVGWYS